MRTVKGLRNDMSLSREKYSKLIGVSQNTLGNYENFNTVPDIETAIKICDLSGISDVRQVQWTK